MGLFALALRWLDWRAATLLALAALLFNLFAMPRVGRGIYRDATRPRDPGIVAYPAMVLVLVLLFRHELAAAAALWGMMAFGDPAATIAGKLLDGPSLPWNPKKSWTGLAAYFVVGTIAAALLWSWVSVSSSPLELLLPVVLLGAFLESLDTGLDDNWTPPIPCALLLALESVAMSPPGSWLGPAGDWSAALAVNGIVALVTFRLRIVALSGAIAGALIGFVVLALGGWAHYTVLWAFFLFGTLATRLGYRRKQSLGTAQERKGRRTARHVVANCGLPALLVLLAHIALPGAVAWLAVAFAAALAAALADTLGTEVGSLYGRRPVSLASARAVAPGTPGAVSLAGLLGGVLGAFAIGAVAAGVRLVAWDSVWIVASAGIAGSLAESLLADLARLRGRAVEHEFANAFNTFVGAIVALELLAWARQGSLPLPFEWRGV